MASYYRARRFPGSFPRLLLNAQILGPDSRLGSIIASVIQQSDNLLSLSPTNLSDSLTIYREPQSGQQCSVQYLAERLRCRANCPGTSTPWSAYPRPDRRWSAETLSSARRRKANVRWPSPH